MNNLGSFGAKIDKLYCPKRFCRRLEIGRWAWPSSLLWWSENDCKLICNRSTWLGSSGSLTVKQIEAAKADYPFPCQKIICNSGDGIENQPKEIRKRNKNHRKNPSEYVSKTGIKIESNIGTAEDKQNKIKRFSSIFTDSLGRCIFLKKDVFRILAETLRNIYENEMAILIIKKGYYPLSTSVWCSLREVSYRQRILRQFYSSHSGIYQKKTLVRGYTY